MTISEKCLNQLVTDFKDEIYEIYYTDVIKDKGIDFKTYLNIAEDEIKELISQVVNIDESLYEKILKETSKKKKNWISYETDNPNSAYNKTISNAKFLFKAENIEINNCTNIDDYISLLTEDLKKWRYNEKQGLTKFKYIDKKRISTIQRALIDDIKVFILQKVVEYYKSNNSKSKYEVQINSLVTTATDPTNKLILEQKEDSYLYDYNVEGNQLIYKIELDDVKNLSVVEQYSKVLGQIFKVLNDNDTTIFQHLIKKRTNTFFMDGKIKFFLDDLCNEIYGYCSTERKDRVIASLYKMSAIKTIGQSSNSKSGLITSLINDVLVDSRQGKKTEVTIEIGTAYRDEIITGNVTKVYSYLYDAVKENAYAKKILFFLQKERVILHYSKDKNIIENSIVIKVPYTYFGSAIIFTNKKKYNNIKSLENSLNIIKEFNTIISKESKRIGDYFELHYNPLSEEELKDLEMRIDTTSNLKDSI